MKLHDATIKVQIDSETPEAAQHLANLVAHAITKQRSALDFDGVGFAQVRRGSVSRLRPHRRRK